MEEVRKIAGGRIWSGEDALKIGLVDKLGGVRDAIDLAKTEAGLPLDVSPSHSLNSLAGLLSWLGIAKPLGGAKTLSCVNGGVPYFPSPSASKRRSTDLKIHHKFGARTDNLWIEKLHQAGQRSHSRH